jgi:uncharacterized protein YoxC
MQRKAVERMGMGNFGPWELILLLFYVAAIAVPVVFVIWLIKTLKRIEKHLGGIEDSLSRMDKS